MFTEAFRNREILGEREEGGYPRDYLLSRVRGRTTALVTDWEPLLGDAVPLESLSSSRYGGLVPGTPSASLWRCLLAEYRWVYLQMDRGLRDIFRPYFVCSELRTLFFCLRMRAAGEDVRVEQMVSVSLFSREFRKVLLGRGDIRGVVAETENFFLSLSSRFRGLGERYASEGLKGVEEHLANRYLEYVLEGDPDPLIREFFVRLVDARNVIALYKHLRWELKKEPYFVSGGSIKTAKLRSVLRREAIFEVGAYVKSLTGISVTDPAGCEQALYRGMTRFLRKKRRAVPDVGLILDYLWRCSIEVTNLGIILHGKDMERDMLRGELVV